MSETSEKKTRPGHFVWRELMSTDPAAAKAFYGGLFGWTFEEAPMPSGSYTLIKTEQGQIGGLTDLMPGAPPMSCWASFISVDDVDATAAKVSAHGGRLHVPPSDIPGVGRFAVFADPAGAVANLLRLADGDPEAPERPPLHSFCWETLNTDDVPKALDFYREVIGWNVVSGPSNMAVFAAGETQVADVETAPPGPGPHWLTHVVVANLGASREKAVALGGSILMGEVPIPEIGTLCIIQDPTGAVLSMFEPASRPAA